MAERVRREGRPGRSIAWLSALFGLAVAGVRAQPSAGEPPLASVPGWRLARQEQGSQDGRRWVLRLWETTPDPALAAAEVLAESPDGWRRTWPPPEALRVWEGVEHGWRDGPGGPWLEVERGSGLEDRAHPLRVRERFGVAAGGLARVARRYAPIRHPGQRVNQLADLLDEGDLGAALELVPALEAAGGRERDLAWTLLAPWLSGRPEAGRARAVLSRIVAEEGPGALRAGEALLAMGGETDS